MNNWTSIRFKLYLGAGLFLFLYFIYYNFTSSNKYSGKFSEGTIVFLFSDQTDSKHDAPYCDVGLINRAGFRAITNDKFYDNSPSYLQYSNSVVFESKREQPILGLSGRSKLYSKSIEVGSMIELKVEERGSFEEPYIYDKTGSFLTVREDQDCSYLKVYNTSNNSIVFSLPINKSGLVEFFVAGAYILIVDYEKKADDPLKVQLYDYQHQVRVGLEEISMIHKRPINSSSKNTFYLMDDVESSLYELLPDTKQLRSIGTIGNLPPESEIVSVIEPGYYLLLDYSQDSNRLLTWFNGKVSELFTSNYIGDIRFYKN